MKQRIYNASLASPQASAPLSGGLPEIRQGNGSGGDGILKAAIGSGFIINEILAREYRTRREAEVNDAVLDVTRQFELWRGDYEERNQGSLGVNALEDYSRKFDELANAAQRNFGAGADEVFPEMLKRKLTERGLFAVRDGASFAARQREVWLTSQAHAQEAEFMQYAAANPQDSDGIAFRRNELLQSQARLRPGQDIGAMVAKLDRETLETRLLALEAQGDYDGMEKLLSTRKRLTDAGITSKSPLGHWAAAHNNPGCVTTNGVDMAIYATPEEGVAAIMERAAAYAKRKHDTPTKIMKLYAPENQNDTAEYIRFICKATGKGPHEKVDTSDPVFLKAFAKAIARKENSVTLPDDLLQRGLEYYQTKGKPPFMGSIPRAREGRLALLGSALAPEQLMRFQKSIEAGRKLAAGQKLEAQTLAWSQQLESMPKADQGRAIEEWTQGLDPESRESARNALYDFLFRLDRRDGRDERIAADAKASQEQEKTNAHIEQMLGLPESYRMRYIEHVAGGASPEDRMLANRLFAASQERKRIEDGSWRNSWQSAFDSALGEVAGASAKEQESRLHSLIGAYSRNSEDADMMLAYGMRFMERQQRAAKAREAEFFQSLAPLQKQGNLPAIRQAIQNARAKGQLSADGAARADELFFGPASEESRANIQALQDARVMIGQGLLQTPDERKQYAAIHRLTLAQEKELLAFQGSDADLNFGRLAQAAKMYGISNLSPRQFDILAGFLPKDRKITDRDIYELLAIFSQRESSWIGAGNTLLKSIENDNGDISGFRPKIEDHEAPILESWLKQRGLPVTSHNMESLKKMQIASRLGLKVKEDFEK